MCFQFPGLHHDDSQEKKDTGRIDVHFSTNIGTVSIVTVLYIHRYKHVILFIGCRQTAPDVALY